MRRLLLLLLILIAGLESRAGRSSISGHITTASGNALDSVLVRLSAENGWQFDVRGDASGYFSITGLDAKTYTAVVSRKGYASKRFLNLRIDSGKIAHLALDAALEPAPRKAFEMTTMLYTPRAAKAIAPGHWVAVTRTGNPAKAVSPERAVLLSSATPLEIVRPAGDHNGTITGTLKDQRGEPIVNAYVEITMGGVVKGRELTDFDGIYTVRPLDRGRYDVTFKSNGKELTITDVTLAADQMRTVNGTLSTPRSLECVTVRTTRKYVPPIIDPKEPSGRSVKTAEQIEAAATRNTLDMAARSAPVSQPGRDGSIAIGGSRGSGTKVIIDGVQVNPDAAVFTAGSETPSAGALTSGEINDFAKWSLWEDVSYKQLKDYRSAWKIRPENRITVLVKASNGMPLVNADIALASNGKAIWQSRTDNTGKAELWYDMFRNDSTLDHVTSLQVRAGGVQQTIYTPKTFDQGINTFQTNIPCSNPQQVDIAFLVDATGSMGDEISYLKAELGDILDRVSKAMPLADVRTGALFYRDAGDEYLVRSSMLIDSFGLTTSFIAKNDAAGGGDGPEAVESALAAGLELGWRPGATARLAFLVLDAPPHGDSVTFAKMEALIRAYAARGIRLIPVACSGSDKPTEYLLRSIALATNGTYLFLTDHSGIGGAHTAPTTDKFDVEYLNELITRVIRNFSTVPECQPSELALGDASGGTGVADGKATTWRFYPNPTADVLHVDHDEKSGYLYVTDISGKLVQRIAVDPSGHSKVDMKRFPAGMYSIRHSWGVNKEVAGTFVLQH